MVNPTRLTAPGPRLSEVLFERTSRTFASIATLSTNVEALNCAQIFSTGLQTHAAIVGPSGCGKSLIMEAVATRLVEEFGHAPILVSAVDYVGMPSHFNTHEALLLDNVQAVFAGPRMRQLFRMNLEQRMRMGRPVLLAVTMTKPSRHVRGYLPNPREWHVSGIQAPTVSGRFDILQLQAQRYGIDATHRLLRLLANHVHGNPRTLEGALKRLRLAGSEWKTSSDVLRACGLLDPFFGDNPNWDLKAKILRAADSMRSSFYRVNSHDMALYCMLKVANLSEAEVARAAQIGQGETYQRAHRFESHMIKDPEVTAYVDRFVEAVVATLCSE